MSWPLGDKLIVNLSRKQGNEKIVNLGDLFNENPNQIIVVGGTVGEDGSPNTAPLSLIQAKDEKTLLLALLKGDTTTDNVIKNGKLIIEILRQDDLAIGIKGQARVLKEAMDCNSSMLLAEMTVEAVKLDSSPAQVLISGPAATPRSEKGRAFAEGVMAELAREARNG